GSSSRPTSGSPCWSRGSRSPAAAFASAPGPWCAGGRWRSSREATRSEGALAASCVTCVMTEWRRGRLPRQQPAQLRVTEGAVQAVGEQVVDHAGIGIAIRAYRIALGAPGGVGAGVGIAAIARLGDEDRLQASLVDHRPALAALVAQVIQ